MTRFITLLYGALGLAGAAFAQGTQNGNASGGLVYSAPVCPGPASVGSARCHAWVVTDEAGIPRASGIGNGGQAGGGGGGGGTSNTTVSGYGPVQFQTAYALNGTGAGKTVGIVDAYDSPTVEQDLGVYSTYFGLPACTTANGCFKKVNQTGGTRYPKANSGWALEIALDVQAVHAVCPDCKILLVEASSSGLSNLLAAERYAAKNANVVSNSWGASEFSSEASYDSNFGPVPTTVSSGDSGYGVEWPAASTNVTAVGGTTLTLGSGSNRISETVWNGSGSGCSSYETQPSWQTALNLPGCGNRIVADVAADADPATGAAVYDSYGYSGQKGWFQVGGTSLSAPIIAAAYALAQETQGASVLYSNSSGLFDVTSGFNGSCGSYLCAGEVGYDGPTGLGSPDGISAF